MMMQALTSIHRHLSGVTTKHVIQVASFHTTNSLATKTAGRHKVSVKHDKPLTYEMANQPDMIGVRKSWNSFNTTALTSAVRTAEVAHEEVFIRKFIHGTWPRLLASDVIIKRRGNLIVISFMCLRATAPSSIYFLLGYTEEVLSYVLKCNVKIELQTINDQSDLVYKYI